MRRDVMPIPMRCDALRGAAMPMPMRCDAIRCDATRCDHQQARHLVTDLLIKRIERSVLFTGPDERCDVMFFKSMKMSA
jgi:hypothetical protein